MKMLCHKHVVRFFGQRTFGSTHYLFLEYADGGELFDRIDPDHGMEPGLAQHFFLQLLLGMVRGGWIKGLGVEGTKGCEGGRGRGLNGGVRCRCGVMRVC